MRKLSIFFVLIIIFASLAGCTSDAVVPYTPSTETMDISRFTIPDGYTLEQENDNTAKIYHNGQIVGGIILTGLDRSCIREKTHRSVSMYLDYLAPIPLIPEWIIMQSDDVLLINLSVTDPDTDVRTETSRRIFVIEDLVYDAWCNNAFISEEDSRPLFSTLIYGIT